MSAHQVCRPPASAGKVLRGILDGKVRKRDTSAPMHAFITEDPTDETALIIWTVDCACVGNPKCPRVQAFQIAADLNYDSASVQLVEPAPTKVKIDLSDPKTRAI